MKKYRHAFANYPTGFKGCVISPTKICLQFTDPQIKLRIDPETRNELKKLPDNDRYIEVPEHGVEISVTAVGCQMPVVEQYQLDLIDAYRTYAFNHSGVYLEKYSKDFIDFLIEVNNKLNTLIKDLEACHAKKD